MRNVLSLSVLGVLVSLSAFADPPVNTIMKVTPQAEKPAEKKAPGTVGEACLQQHHVELAELGALGNSLDLTAAQKPVFDAWRKTRIELWTAVPCPPPPTGLSVPAPTRIQNQITMLSATLDSLHRELPAAKALYDALTPEQRKIFDGPIRLAAPPPAAPPSQPPAAH